MPPGPRCSLAKRFRAQPLLTLRYHVNRIYLLIDLSQLRPRSIPLRFSTTPSALHLILKDLASTEGVNPKTQPPLNIATILHPPTLTPPTTFTPPVLSHPLPWHSCPAVRGPPAFTPPQIQCPTIHLLLNAPVFGEPDLLQSPTSRTCRTLRPWRPCRTGRPL